MKLRMHAEASMRCPVYSPIAMDFDAACKLLLGEQPIPSHRSSFQRSIE